MSVLYDLLNKIIGKVNASVKTVNGVAPDASGNVEVEGGGVSSWNDLTDKPFGETTGYGDTLTWDGVTDGLEAVDIGLGYLHYRVSDAIVSISNLENGYTITIDGDVAATGENSPASEAMSGMVMLCDGVVLCAAQDFPDYGIVAGIYIGGVESEVVFTIPEYTTFFGTTIKKIDMKYMPSMVCKFTFAMRTGSSVLYIAWPDGTEVTTDELDKVIRTYPKVLIGSSLLVSAAMMGDYYRASIFREDTLTHVYTAEYVPETT